MRALFLPANSTFVLQVLASAFLAVLFLQSGLDKLWDFRTNREWLESHFSKSIFAGGVVVLLVVLTILELAAGTLSAVGCLMLLVRKTSLLAYYGAVVSAATILALFFGQRIAKDYAGAATLVSYFLLSLATICLLGRPQVVF